MSAAPRVLAGLALLALAGCSTIREAERLEPAVARRVREAPSPRFRAHLRVVPVEAGYPETRERALERARELLEASPWFEDVDARPDEADVWVAVMPIEVTPPGARPVRRVGPFLLSAIVPVGWQERVGYRMSFVRPETGVAVDVDTQREGQAYVWSLAWTMNFSPEWGFGPSLDRELAQVHAQLLPLLDEPLR